MTISGEITFASAVRIQARVVGALILRELHTRFGRHNIGYLWAILEPMLLAVTVTSIHFGLNARLPFRMDTAPFWITGYTPWILFRSTILRASGAVESNRGLLYHRMVTLLDVMLARALLEAAVTTFALFLLLGGAVALGLGGLPARPILMFAGMGFLLWLGFGLSLLNCAACAISPLAERLVDPFMYLMLPFSGVFYLIEWIPRPYQDYLRLFPTTQMIEMVREGQFANFDSSYIDPLYLIAWCMAATLLGLLALRVIRPKINLE